MSTVFPDIATGDLRTQYPVQQTGEAALLASRTAVLHQEVRILQVETGELRSSGFELELDEATRAALKRRAVDLLADARNAGLSWRDVARIVGVSVPAVQKWRRGEGIDPANHTALARLVALLDILRADLIDDPVSWLETDVQTGVHLSKVDMLAGGRYDLVRELASDRGEQGGVEDALDRFDPTWRTTYVDDRFEVFEAADGNLSIRPRW